MEDLLWKIVKNNKKVSHTLEEFIFAFMDAIEAEHYDIDDIRSHINWNILYCLTLYTFFTI